MPSKTTPTDAEPAINIGEIDEVIHGRLRLAKTGSSNGNLSTHLSKLEAAGYISQEKGYRGKRPRTLVSLTAAGRKAWIQYLEAMKELLGK